MSAIHQGTQSSATAYQRGMVLVTAFLGWMFAGLIMVIVPLAGRAATIDFLGPGKEGQIGSWFSWYICAFLLGAAAGGLLFGWLGDRIGRAKAMGLSILTYSLLTGLTWFVTRPEQFLVLRFLACLGVGGMWPNGVALVSEFATKLPRPILAGLIGASANLGFMLLALLGMFEPISPESWRWVLLVGATPAALGVFVLVGVPESDSWLAVKEASGGKSAGSPIQTVFRPPILKLTLLGICLGAVPLLGNWGGANWTVPWAGQIGGAGDTALKAWTQWTKSGGGALGALVGGWVAAKFGRRATYFTISLASLLISLHLFINLRPGEPTFLYWVFGIGFFGTLYFGWLPLFLPELFPTRVRATGSGVSFNFGRIATAIGVLGSGQLMLRFDGDYARVGQVTCLVYVLGMAIIWLAPNRGAAEDLAD